MVAPVVWQVSGGALWGAVGTAAGYYVEGGQQQGGEYHTSGFNGIWFCEFGKELGRI